jgi:hypothetical protein
MKKEVIELGLIKGRHSLPVTKYILEESEVTTFTKDKLYPIIKSGLEKCDIIHYDYYGYDCYSCWCSQGKEYGQPPAIKLYITGLTIVTLTTLDILNHWGYEVEIIGYDPNEQKYYSQGIFNNIYNCNF